MVLKLGGGGWGSKAWFLSYRAETFRVTHPSHIFLRSGLILSKSHCLSLEIHDQQYCINKTAFSEIYVYMYIHKCLTIISNYLSVVSPIIQIIPYEWCISALTPNHPQSPSPFPYLPPSAPPSPSLLSFPTSLIASETSLPTGLSVSRLFGRCVGHNFCNNFLKGWEVSLPWSFRALVWMRLLMIKLFSIEFL